MMEHDADDDDDDDDEHESDMVLKRFFCDMGSSLSFGSSAFWLIGDFGSSACGDWGNGDLAYLRLVQLTQHHHCE